MFNKMLISMKQVSKIVLIMCAFIGSTLSSMADRGIGKKSKNKVWLNIASPSSSLKNSISFNLKMGLKYTGSLLAPQENTNKHILNNTLVTYQKGNAVYIIPYKQKIIIPDVKQNYTGFKLILRASK
ncbi:MAG: hypothetical protein IPJ81_10310 [Chitinophagaceae bacterium]|nr:hypothetical protein [Chitinophagaceae bacterium]